MKKITFICDKIPNHLTCHSLVSTIFNKAQEVSKIEYSVEKKEKEIYLFLGDKEDYQIEDMYSFNHYINEQQCQIRVKKVDQKELEPSYILKESDVVSVSGVISYAIHTKHNGKGKKYCPINVDGKYKKSNNEDLDSKKFLLNYLKIQTGLSFDSYPLKFAKYVSDEITLEQTRNWPQGFKIYNKIGNSFYLTGQAVVDSAQLASRLEYCSVGQNKSYGFGKLTLLK